MFNALTKDEELDKLADLTWEAIVAALDKTEKQGRNKHGIHVIPGDTEILCKTETQAKGIADFLEDLGFYSVTTGYYDPEEDKKDGLEDEYTGWYYVDFA